MEKIKDIVGLNISKQQLQQAIEYGSSIVLQKEKIWNDVYQRFIRDRNQFISSKNKYIVTLKGCREVTKLTQQDILHSNCDFAKHLKERQYYFINILQNSFVLFKDKETIIALLIKKTLPANHRVNIDIAIPFTMDCNKNIITHNVTNGMMWEPIKGLPRILNYIFSLDPIIVEVAGGIKKKTGLVDGYHNQTKSTLHLVTDRWNQETIRTTPFGIKGHFRMQACGPNLSLRKKIWISDHSRKGYRLTAKSQKSC